MRSAIRQQIEGRNTDARTAREGMMDPDEMRQWSRFLGQGQRLDIFKVETDCSACGAQEVPTNVVGLCGTCARRLAEGGMIGQRADRGPKQRRKSITVEKMDAPQRLNLLAPWKGTRAPWALLLVLCSTFAGCATSPEPVDDCTTDTECMEVYGIEY